MTGKTVNFVFSGNLPSKKLRCIHFPLVLLVLRWCHLTIVSSGEMATEFFEELPSVQVDIAWLIGSLPTPIGYWNLRSDAIISQYPGLANPPAQNVGAPRVEMPTGGHGVIIVTLATCVTHGNGSRLGISRLDLLILIIPELDEVGDGSAVAVMTITMPLGLFLRLAKGKCSRQKHQRQQCPDDLNHLIDIE